MAIIKTISDLLWGMPLIVLILLAGIIFTVGSKFFQIAHLKHILKNTIGTLFSKKDNGKGMMKPLEVISIAVGGAVGVGNIGGVATAIAVGGPGAAFWIWVAAFLGMMMKMAEVSLAVYYRSKDERAAIMVGLHTIWRKGWDGIRASNSGACWRLSSGSAFLEMSFPCKTSRSHSPSTPLLAFPCWR